MSVSTNCTEWDFLCDDEWIEVQKTQSGLTLSATENASSKPNRARVTVTAYGEGDDNSASATIDVVQNDGALVIEVQLPDGATMIAPVVGEMDCMIDWGDGTTDHIQGYFDGLFNPQPNHLYAQGGTYQIRISGQMPWMDIGLSFTDTEAGYITAVVQWGNTGLTSMDRALKGCVNLVSIPGDIDGSFAEVTQFSNAFYGCRSLTEIPADLFAYADKADTFAFCFDSSDIKNIPAGLFDNCSAATNFISTFSGCPILTIPDELFSGCVSAQTFSSTFYNCQLLQSIPENLFRGCKNVDKFSYCFRQCPSLTEIPENLFADNPAVTTFGGTFTMCYSLASIPEKLFAGNPLAESFGFCFMDCSSLLSIPAGLFDNNRAASGFGGTFRGCMVVGGESPYTVIDGKKVHLYERSEYPDHFVTPDSYDYCFSNCNGLTDYEYMHQNYPEWAKTYVHYQ